MTNPVYDVSTTFTHPDGHESYKPLMLQIEVWEEIKGQTGEFTLRYGFTRDEAETVATLALPYLNAEHADFIAEGGRIHNVVDTFFG